MQDLTFEWRFSREKSFESAMISGLVNDSGQIIATSHDRFPSNGGLVREMGPLISGKSRLVKYYNLTR